MSLVYDYQNGQKLSFTNDTSEFADSSTGPVVSELMNYGSFSGADIKAVVHMPWPEAGRMRLKEIAAQIDTLQSERELTTQGYYEGISAQDAAALDAELGTIDSVISSLQDETHRIETPAIKVLAELQTISWSVFREKNAVRTLGAVYPRGFTRGGRTIGGTMVFTMFHQHVLYEILKLNPKYYNTGTSDFDNFLYTTNLSDQLPPLDISLICANEYGMISYMGLYGVEFVQEGGTFSIEDIFSESVIQYVARDIDLLRPVEARAHNAQGVSNDYVATASGLLNEANSRAGDIEGVAVRRNPFI
jgi:hypothetical protein